VAAWFNAPADKRSPVYLEMSRRLQRKLKELVAGYYLQDPSVYARDLLAVRPLLVYAALPASTAVRFHRDTGALEAINDRGDIHWDVYDAGLIRAMARSARTRANLESQLTRVAALLREIPELSRQAPFYDPSPGNVSSIIETALRPMSASSRCPAQLGALLRFERMAVEAARDAGLAAAAFCAAAGRKQLTKALEELGRFGSELTSAFHHDIAPLYGGGAVRALGTMLFIEAAMSLSPAAEAPKPSAMLTLTVFPGEWSGFDPQALVHADPDGPTPVIQERLVT
jgi:hypothetical protein